MNEEASFRLWVDPDGEVWLEDPAAGLIDLARALEPGFAWAAPVPEALGNRLARTRTWPVPRPWPESLVELWALHDHHLASLRAGGTPPVARPGAASLLTLKQHLAARLLRACVLCEHRCGVDRGQGERGRCGVGARSRFAPVYVHEAEEREIAPSLCVPLTGCSWHCVYCHTAELINRVDQGTPLDETSHAALTREAAAPGVRSVSFVGGNPDHHLVDILGWLAATPTPFDRALVWNSNMFGSPELYRLLEGVVDVHVGDLRYGNDACAFRLSGLDRCWEPVARNWQLVRGTGALIIARVLVLPGHHGCCTVPILEHLSRHVPEALLSLLDQYHPAYRAARVAPELARRPSPEELGQAEALAQQLGLRFVAAARA